MGNEYINQFDNQIKEYEGKNLLLHCCCAPCSSATLEMLMKHFNVTLYFYNPNISPYEEFSHRADELLRFAKEFAPKCNVIIAPYEGEAFDEIAIGREDIPEKGERCYLCYKMRMENTARYAKEKGYDCFTTALSISPHKNARWINEIGCKISEKLGIIFIASDFKKREGYKRSIVLSKEYNLYRQDYCGCKFSKKVIK